MSRVTHVCDLRHFDELSAFCCVTSARLRTTASSQRSKKNLFPCWGFTKIVKRHEHFVRILHAFGVPEPELTVGRRSLLNSSADWPRCWVPSHCELMEYLWRDAYSLAAISCSSFATVFFNQLRTMAWSL